MKKAILITTALVLAALVYSYETVRGNANDFSQSPTSEYIIMQIASNNSDVVVYSGGNNTQHFAPTPEQKKDYGTYNLVIDLMNKYADQGYTLVSSSSYHINGPINGTQCILKKVK